MTWRNDKSLINDMLFCFTSDYTSCWARLVYLLLISAVNSFNSTPFRYRVFTLPDFHDYHMVQSHCRFN